MSREIRRRRNELVTEMFCLLKRKDELGDIMRVDEGDEALQEYVGSMDILAK